MQSTRHRIWMSNTQPAIKLYKGNRKAGGLKEENWKLKSKQARVKWEGSRG